MLDYHRTILLLSIDFISNINRLRIPPLGITTLKPFIINPWQPSPYFIPDQSKFALHKIRAKA
jgi:hypothetical protein